MLYNQNRRQKEQRTKRGHKMKFTCSQAALLRAVNTCIKAVLVRTTIPILKGILMEVKDGRLTLSASDLDLSIQTNP